VESSKHFGRIVTSQNGVLIENIVLLEIFQPKRKEVTGEGENLIMKSFVNFNLSQILFYLVHQLPVGQVLFIHEISRSHNEAPHSVGLLWTSDRPDAGTST
jgi:hypothetical protein